jgi:VanZ family protein
VVPRKVIRLVAWVVLTAAVVLTILPAELRPVTGAPSGIEHFAMFFLIGLTFALGHSRSDYSLCGAAIAFAGLLELLKHVVPTRHARLSEFVIDALAAVIGIAVSGVIDRNRLLPLGSDAPTGV